jgi:hypothetical protein
MIYVIISNFNLFHVLLRSSRSVNHFNKIDFLDSTIVIYVYIYIYDRVNTLFLNFVVLVVVNVNNMHVKYGIHT